MNGMLNLENYSGYIQLWYRNVPKCHSFYQILMNKTIIFKSCSGSILISSQIIWFRLYPLLTKSNKFTSWLLQIVKEAISLGEKVELVTWERKTCHMNSGLSARVWAQAAFDLRKLSGDSEISESPLRAPLHSQCATLSGQHFLTVQSILETIGNLNNFRYLKNQFNVLRKLF